MLAELQRHLQSTYALPPAEDVRDFLVTDRAAAERLSPAPLPGASRESVFLQQDDDGVALSVYLDEETLRRVAAGDPFSTLHAGLLSDFWQVLEGISHFVCLVHRAQHDRQVSLFELELQAEVDKFVVSMQLAKAQQRHTLADRLHERLFGAVAFHPELADDERARYADANALAARFCHQLNDELIADGALDTGELRRFFRLPAADKLSHIHARVLN